MSGLAPILFSELAPRNNGVAETIAAEAAESLNAAFQQIFDESHIRPFVLGPVGGGRTEAQQAHLVALGQSNTMLSDHREDAIERGRAAADIDNHDRLRAWNESRFLAILEAHGWHNMTNDGQPFPSELWHFAKHGITTASSGPTTPLPTDTNQEDDMRLVFHRGATASHYMLIGAGLALDIAGTETTGDVANWGQILQVDTSKLHVIDDAQRATAIAAAAAHKAFLKA